MMASILLVDDDSSVLLTFSIALRRYGHEVTVAGDGLQALKHLRRRKFDALISDIRMPGMSGLELAARVKSRANAPRIVLISAHYDPSLRPNPAAIADAFLQKPLDMDMLCQLLECTPLPSPDSAPNSLPATDARRLVAPFNNQLAA